MIMNIKNSRYQSISASSPHLLSSISVVKYSILI